MSSGACLLLVSVLAVQTAAAEPSGLSQVLRGAGCLECHDGVGRKGNLALDGPLPDFAVETGRTFWERLHDRVRRGEMPPSDAAGSARPGISGLLAEVGRGLAAAERAERRDVVRGPMRRLTRGEILQEVGDVLGTRRSIPAMPPEDDREGGLARIASAQHLSGAHLQACLEFATAAAGVLFEPGPRPEVRRHRFAMAGRNAVKVALAPHPTSSSSLFRPPLRVLGEGVVFFVDDPGASARFPEVQSPWGGTWRLRVAGSAVGPGNVPVAIGIWAVGGDAPRPVGRLELSPGKTAVHLRTVHLEGGEHLEFRAEGCGRDAAGRAVEEVGAEAFEGRGWLLETVEVEGPDPVDWPSASLRRWSEDVAAWKVDEDGRLHLTAADPKAALAVLVRRMAEEIFRGPVSDAEAAALVRVAGDPAAGPDGLAAATRRALVEAWMSPDFLFLREPPGPLDGPALASRLSHFLWSAAPDAGLRRFAADGSLVDPAVLRAQAQRMLEDPRAMRFVSEFAAGWLELGRIGETDPDRTLYPEFDPALQESMVAETEAFLWEILRADLPASSLADPGFACVDGRLARLYGIPGVHGDRVRRVELPPELRGRRGGLPFQASVLKVTANGTTSSPVARGAWVMHRLLGRVSPPPPPGVGSVEPDTRGATTFRRQLERHRDQASCAACHRHIDPAGLALENYDPVGGWRDRYRIQGPGVETVASPGGRPLGYGHGPAVDATAELPGGRRLEGPADLSAWLRSQDDEIARTWARAWIAYATGAFPGHSEEAELQAVLARSRGRGLRSLLLEIVGSRIFRER